MEWQSDTWCKASGAHSVEACAALVQWGLDGQVGIPGAHCAPGRRGQIGAVLLRHPRALEGRVDPVRRLRNMTPQDSHRWM